MTRFWEITHVRHRARAHGLYRGGRLRHGRQSGVLGLVAGRVSETVPCLLPNGYRVIEPCRGAITVHLDIKFICRGEKQA